MKDQQKQLSLKDLPPTLCRKLVILRYALPLISLLFFVVSGLLHSVYAVQGGTNLWVSPIQLCFNTLKTARLYFLSGNGTSGTLYGLLLAGSIVSILCFLITLALAIFSLTQLCIVLTATDRTVARRAKIRHKTVFPNRICLFLSNLLLIVPALFCEYVSAIGKRYIGLGGATLFVRCNIPLIFLSFLLLLTLALSVILAPQEKACDLDLFDIKEHEKEEEKGEGEDDESGEKEEEETSEHGC